MTSKGNGDYNLHNLEQTVKSFETQKFLQCKVSVTHQQTQPSNYCNEHQPVQCIAIGYGVQKCTLVQLGQQCWSSNALGILGSVVYEAAPSVEHVVQPRPCQPPW